MSQASLTALQQRPRSRRRSFQRHRSQRHSTRLGHRARAGARTTLGGGEITAILALAGATDVITFSGGFPDPATFPAGMLADIAARLIAERAGGRAAVLGNRGPRRRPRLRLRAAGSARGPRARRGRADDHQRRHRLHGTARQELPRSRRRRRRGGADLPGRASWRSAATRPTCAACPSTTTGMRVDVLADLLAAGLRPKIVYTIPDYQNPTGLSMSADRRTELVGLARRYGFLILRTSRTGSSQLRAAPPPRQPVVAGARRGAAGGHVLQDLLAPASGWAGRPGRPRSSAGSWSPSRTPTSARARSASGCSRNTAGAGTWTARSSTSRALYARRAALMTQALAAHMPDGTTWTTPRGGFYVWLTAPDGVDTVALSAAAAGPEGRLRARTARSTLATRGAPQIRLAYSRVADELIDEGIRRIGDVVRDRVGGTVSDESLGDAASHFTTEAQGEPAGPGRYVNVDAITPGRVRARARVPAGAGPAGDDELRQLRARRRSAAARARGGADRHRARRRVHLRPGRRRARHAQGGRRGGAAWVPHGAWTTDSHCLEIDVFAPPRESLLKLAAAQAAEARRKQAGSDGRG